MTHAKTDLEKELEGAKKQIADLKAQVERIRKWADDEGVWQVERVLKSDWTG